MSKQASSKLARSVEEARPSQEEENLELRKDKPVPIVSIDEAIGQVESGE